VRRKRKTSLNIGFVERKHAEQSVEKGTASWKVKKNELQMTYEIHKKKGGPSGSGLRKLAASESPKKKGAANCKHGNQL